MFFSNIKELYSYYINDDAFIIENQNFQVGFPVRACTNSEVFRISYDSDDGIFILTGTKKIF